MIKLSPSGKISKNANKELCLDTKFTVSIDVRDRKSTRLNSSH